MRETGLADPARRASLFGSFWLIPLITALVAGDIVATEDNHGTLKTILTRSADRWQVFAGKALAAVDLRGRRAVRLRARRPDRRRADLGLRPGDAAVRAPRSSTGRGLVLLGAGTLAYLMPVLALAAIAAPALDRHAQLRRGRGRHADGLDR